MARYESDSVGFAERQFEGVRQREDERVQQQKKREKKLLLLQTVAKGANALINQRAKELEAKQIPQKLYYESLSKRANVYLDADQARIAKGTSTVDYLADMSQPRIEAMLREQYPYMEDRIIKQYARANAVTLANDEQENYKNLITQATALSTMSGEDLDKYYKNAQSIPRNPFEWFSSKVKSKINKENEDTIEYKAKQQDAFYGTGWDKKFGSFAETLRNYESTIGNGYEIATAIERIDAKIKKNKLFGVEMNPEGIIEETEKTLSDDKTTVTVKTKFSVPYKDVKTGELFYQQIKENSEVTYDVGTIADTNDIKTLTEMFVARYKDPVTDEEINPRKLFMEEITINGVITKESLQKGWEFFSENPDYRRPEFEDFEMKDKGFTSFKNNSLGRFFAEGIMNVEIVEGREVYSLKPDIESRKRAKELGLTDGQLLEKYDELLIEGVSGKGMDEIIGAREDYKSWRANKISLMNSPNFDDKQRELLTTAVKPVVGSTGKAGQLYDIFKDIIDASADQDTIALGKADLSKIFTSGFSNIGEVDLHWDNLSQQFFISK